jgi:DNA replication protein
MPYRARWTWENANVSHKPRKFAGFAPGKFNMTAVPAPFFTELLPLVDDLAELKVLLFCLYALPQKEGEFPYLRRADFAGNAELLHGLVAARPDADAEATLDDALARAVQRGALLTAGVTQHSETLTLYFVNTARGRRAVDQVRAGRWKPGDLNNPVEILPERPGIYELYEANIGLLTPMIADELKDMEQEFPVHWIEEAIREAVHYNKRSLRYIRAILERWRNESRDNQSGDDDGKRFISGEYGEFINH